MKEGEKSALLKIIALFGAIKSGAVSNLRQVAQLLEIGEEELAGVLGIEEGASDSTPIRGLLT